MTQLIIDRRRHEDAWSVSLPASLRTLAPAADCTRRMGRRLLAADAELLVDNIHFPTNA